MKNRITRLISIMLVSIFLLAAAVPAVTAFAAYNYDAVAADDEAEPGTPGDSEPPAEAEEEEKDDTANLSPFKQFLINMLEQLLALTESGKGAGGSSSLFSRAINAIIEWLKK